MTDSENEAPNPNILTFGSANTIVSARGPNTNIKPFSFCNDRVSSNCLPRNFEHQRYAESVSDQKSMYFRRETSPMSTYSACDISRPWNFQQYYNRLRPQQSLYHGRSGSPMSIRSIDSSASVASVADIIFAFKNHKFNKSDARAIKDAYNKWMKQRIRKRMEKRRNMRFLLKGSKSKTDYDSGEQGSDSSISSNDDCRSEKTSYNDYSRKLVRNRMDLLESRKTMKDSGMVIDSLQNSHQSSFRNISSISNMTVNRKQNFNHSLVSQQSNVRPTLKERFNKNAFVLPSLRFNATTSSVIPVNAERYKKQICPDNRDNNKSTHPLNDRQCESDSDEEIFSGMNQTVREKNELNLKSPLQNHSENCISPHKRHLDSDDDLRLPSKKRSKISSPIKNLQKNSDISNTKDTNYITNDDNSHNFEFTKPMLPVRKAKLKLQDRVRTKSNQPLTGFIEPIINNMANSSVSAEPTTVQEKCSHNVIQDYIDSFQSSNASMRSSFIKRKLFTQKLDIAEKANTNHDAINSPQNVYEVIQKQKNKARKLVSSQSCLNRDIQDDNNYLELIHKIVPPDCMNITNQTIANQTKQDSKSNNNDDNWDVTSVISVCNENDGSDTFTDEEIFKSDNNKDNKNVNKKQKDNIHCNLKPGKHLEKNNNSKCIVSVEKLNNKYFEKRLDNKKNNISNANLSKTIVKISAKTFWDTDLESDTEYQVTSQKQIGDSLLGTAKSQFKPPDVPNNSHELKNIEQNSEKSNSLNKNNDLSTNTVSNIGKLNITSLSVRSHRTSKKKKCPNETVIQEPTLKPQIKTATTRSKADQQNAKTTKNVQLSLQSNTNNHQESNNKKIVTSKSKDNNKTPKHETKKVNKNKTKNIPQSNHKLNKNSLPEREHKNIQTPKISGRAKSKSNKENVNKYNASALNNRRSPRIRTMMDKRNGSKINLNISNYESPMFRPKRSCRSRSSIGI